MSTRQRASVALRSPLAKASGGLLAAVLGGGGVSVIHDATKPAPAPDKPGAGVVYQDLKEPLRNLASDLSENDKADRAAVDWSKAEIAKLNQRIRVLERKLRREPGDELEPEAPPPAPSPPRTPKLKERL